MAAVLACGEGAALSHASAAELWSIRRMGLGLIHVSIPASRSVSREGIRIHRRTGIEPTVFRGIPVTSIVDTLIDIRATEADVIEADKRDLIHVGELRHALDAAPKRPGVAPLARLIDRHAFVYTDSDLERAFTPIAQRAGYPMGETQVWFPGIGRADFWYPTLGIVVEVDGGRYHRTPMQQTKDRRRDQAHLMAGRLPLRFTHGQIRYDPREVEAVLRAAAATRLAA
jgi:hypothetical protein